jgi:hypothetical protein
MSLPRSGEESQRGIAMERTNNKLMDKMERFRQELSTVSSSVKGVALYQAFDRLFMDYQEGRIDGEEAERRLDALKAEKAKDTEGAEGLRVRSSQSVRQQALLRNHEALAERFLAMPRGSWNRSHVEVVQQAISVLNDVHADELSYDLQKRLSHSVWAGNFEMADTVDVIETERASFESMLDSLVSHDLENGYDTQGTDRALATDVKNQVIEAVSSEAHLAKLRAQVERAKDAADKLAVSEEYVSKLESESLARQKEIAQNFQDKSTRRIVENAVEAIHRAGNSIVSSELAKIRGIQNELMKEIALVGDEHTRIQAQDVFGQLSNLNEHDAERIIHNAELLRHLTQSIHTEGASLIISRLNAIIDKTRSAQSILNYKVNDKQVVESKSDDERALLEAHMMYAMHRMKYEQEARYANHAADMLKALDASVSVPDYSVRHIASKVQKPKTNADKRLHDVAETLKRVKLIAQSERMGDVGLYAPYAGSENNRNAKASLQIADQAAPMFTSIPTIQSAVAKKSNQLMHQVRQIAFLPSVRSEMGFSAKRFQILDEMSDRPLFKRVKFDHTNQDAVDMLPALYKVAGIKMKKVDTPLRKSNGEIDLNISNYEIIKIIENQFDGSMKTRQTESFGGAVDADNHAAERNYESPIGKAAGVALDWIKNRKEKATTGADTQSLIKTGRISAQQISTNLKSEAMTLPKEVQAKLTPFLGFDISNIKVYTGPIAEMASAAMGAQAFTLGKSVFLGKKNMDLSSPEGLGLLAHELLHTTHFTSGDSVNLKEQAAEDVEARVRKAFGAAKQSLALEKKSPFAKVSASTSAALPTDDGLPKKKLLNAEQVFDTVSNMVLEMLLEDVKKERQRSGE